MLDTLKITEVTEKLRLGDRAPHENPPIGSPWSRRRRARSAPVPDHSSTFPAVDPESWPLP